MIYLLVLAVGFMFGCTEGNVKKVSRDEENYSAVLEFSFNQKIYSQTLFGEPPQIAIWCEAIDDSSIKKNIYISHRSFYNEWKGKVECEIALPYWNSRCKRTKYSKVDAVSSATPRNHKKKIYFTLSKKYKWRYFVEINVSADYNEYYRYWTKEGYPDSEGNGQPSIIYTGKILSSNEYDALPQLWGCTDQLNPKANLNYDLSKITTAKRLLKYFHLTVN